MGHTDTQSRAHTIRNGHICKVKPPSITTCRDLYTYITQDTGTNIDRLQLHDALPQIIGLKLFNTFARTNKKWSNLWQIQNFA